MKIWAEINDQKIVQRVLAGNPEDEDGGYSWLIDNLGGVWLETDENTREGVHYNPETLEPSEDQTKAFRGNYAGIGFTYDEDLDAFIPPKPSDDATLDETTFTWIVPEVETPEVEEPEE